MPTHSVYDTGKYQASRASLLWWPSNYKKDGTKRGVVYMHGAGELAASPLNSAPVANPKQKEGELLQAIASVYPLISFDCGVFGQGGTTDSNHFGNTNAQTELTNAIAYLQLAGGGGAKTSGGVLFVGISMGHALSHLWAQAGTNAAQVRAIVGILPVNDNDDIRDNNRGGNRAGVSTAWGTAAWSAPGTPPLPAGANPALSANQTNVKSIPQKLWYASDDAVCVPATCTAYAASMGSAVTLVNMGATGGHSDASVGAAPIADVLAFLAANA